MFVFLPILNSWVTRLGCFCKSNSPALKNVNNSLNTNFYSYLETSGGQSSNPYLNVVYFLNTCVNQTSVVA